MIEIDIQNLINYAKHHLELNELDELYIRNKILEILQVDYFIKPNSVYDVKSLNCPDQIINSIVENALQRKIIAENQIEYLSCKLLDVVSIRPSEIINKFKQHYNIAPIKAFSWLHKYNIRSDYIKSTSIAKNIKWVAEETVGKIEITINLSKPEKSNSEVKKISASSVKYPQCVICPENEGFSGNGTNRQNLRGIPLLLQGEKWFWQYSPYAYFDQHGIAINYEHTPMKVDASTPGKLLDFIDYIPDYFIGCNAALPIIGGSILAHDHFQGGLPQMPMFNAKKRDYFIAKLSPNVEISILEWYNSVIHLECKNRDELEELAKLIIYQWKDYSDIENDIIAKTDVQHNSITIIARKIYSKYTLDLILRNNRTNKEYPEGIFHAHPEYFNIKSEGIGLIEAMGLFILPARLKRQLEVIAKILTTNNNNIVLEDDMIIHENMISRLISKYGTNNQVDAANNYIKLEINQICESILENTAVYKNNQQGQKGFKDFLLSINIEEVKS